jgi:hypothetical protein
MARRGQQLSDRAVRRHQEGYLYEEYLDSPWLTLVIYWLIQTRSVYLAARGQDVTIGRALRPFPRSKPSMPLSRHSAFRTCPSDLFFQPHSDLAHEHSTTCCMRTPTLLENMNSLLKALSDLKVCSDR